MLIQSHTGVGGAGGERRGRWEEGEGGINYFFCVAVLMRKGGGGGRGVIGRK